MIKKSGYGDKFAGTALDSFTQLELYEAPPEPGALSKQGWTAMVKKTYKQYYGKFKDQFNPAEYMGCVEQEGMDKEFSAWLGYED